jgi:catechol 2,3-dioxygenase-like lactoylglutathione lyase family enzyme
LELEQLDHVALAVSDVERSIGWYSDVLGLERRHREWGNTPAMMCVGTTCVALFEIGDEPVRPPPGRDTVAMRHLAFRVDRANFERAQEELAGAGIDVSFQDHGSAESMYFRDPDGHLLEVTTYDLAR